MPNPIYATTTILFLTSASFIYALPNAPNVTAIPLSPGTCQGWPGYVPQPIGNLTQQFFFEARDTSNSSLNGLRSSLAPSNSTSSHLPSTSKSLDQRLIITTDSTLFTYNIFSCTGNGSIADIHGGPNLVFSMDEQDRELGYWSSNQSARGVEGGGAELNPEVYEHEVAGVKADGLFVGWSNVTIWAFELMGGMNSSSEYFRMRLLGSGTRLKDGEIDGFLRIVAL